MFAHLEKSPEHIHTYSITPLSLWNAAALGMTPGAWWRLLENSQSTTFRKTSLKTLPNSWAGSAKLVLETTRPGLRCAAPIRTCSITSAATRDLPALWANDRRAPVPGAGGEPRGHQAGADFPGVPGPRHCRVCGRRPVPRCPQKGDAAAALVYNQGIPEFRPRKATWAIRRCRAAAAWWFCRAAPAKPLWACM